MTVLLTSCGSSKKSQISDNYGSEVEVSVPFSLNEYQDTDKCIRGISQYTSNDYVQARSAAITLAMADLRRKVESSLSGGTSVYQSQVNSNSSETNSAITELEYTSKVEGILSGTRIILDKVTRNTKTGKYTSYIVVELPRSLGYDDATILDTLRSQRSEFVKYLETR